MLRESAVFSIMAEPVGDAVPMIRQLDPNDAEAWSSIRREMLERNPLAFGASIPDEPEVLLETARQRLTERAESAVLGAFDSSRLVGTVGVKRHEGLKERHKAFIWGMYVSETHRGRGLGSLLLREAIDRARSWDGLEQVHLTVSEVAIEARRMYERHGFRAWGREPRALLWEGRAADEHHMVLTLRDSLVE